MAEELLDLVNENPGGPADDELDVQEQKASPPSPTALKLDDWSLRRGAEVLAASERLYKALGFTEEQIKSPPADLTEEERGQRKVAEEAVADFHSAAFEPEPQLADNCEDQNRHRYMKQLLESPEYAALHQDTQLDELASELAAGGFAESWVALAQQAEPTDEFSKDLQAAKAAKNATSQAASDVQDLRDTQAAIGLGQGAAGTNLNTAAMAELFKKVRNNGMLRHIVALAGRYRRFAQAQQRRKTLHGRDDMVGVVLDGDPGRLLPHELAVIDDPDLGMDVMRRLVERQCQCRDYRGVEGKARGPICVVVDESGSMSGSPIHNAKAIALALAWVARHQKRWCCLVGFSGGTEGTYLALPPGSWNQEKLLEWLIHFYGGGTTCDVPLVEVPKNWEALGAPKGKTDLIVITDAQVGVPQEVRKSFLAWKAAEHVKMYSLVLEYSAGDLAAVSDKVHLIRGLSLDEEGVQDVLSV